MCVESPFLCLITVCSLIWLFPCGDTLLKLGNLNASLTFPLPSASKTNTSVPRMFQGLLNIEGLWVQHRVSPEPFNLSLWNFHRMLLIYQTFIWNNNKKDSHVTFGGLSGSHIENMKNTYKHLFYGKINKTSIYIKYQTPGFILIYCFIR